MMVLGMIRFFNEMREFFRIRRRQKGYLQKYYSFFRHCFLASLLEGNTHPLDRFEFEPTYGMALVALRPGRSHILENNYEGANLRS